MQEQIDFSKQIDQDFEEIMRIIEELKQKKLNTKISEND